MKYPSWNLTVKRIDVMKWLMMEKEEGKKYTVAETVTELGAISEQTDQSHRL